MVEIISRVTEDVSVLEIGRFVVRPAEQRVGVDVDVDRDAFRHPQTLVQTSVDVWNGERSFSADGVCVLHHAPLRLAHCSENTQT